MACLSCISLQIFADSGQARLDRLRAQQAAAKTKGAGSDSSDIVPTGSKVSNAQMNTAVGYDPAGSAAACQQVLTELGLSSDTPNQTVLNFIKGNNSNG